MLFTPNPAMLVRELIGATCAPPPFFVTERIANWELECHICRRSFAYEQFDYIYCCPTFLRVCARCLTEGESYFLNRSQLMPRILYNPPISKEQELKVLALTHQHCLASGIKKTRKPPIPTGLWRIVPKRYRLSLLKQMLKLPKIDGVILLDGCSCPGPPATCPVTIYVAGTRSLIDKLKLARHPKWNIVTRPTEDFDSPQIKAKITLCYCIRHPQLTEELINFLQVL